MMIGKTTFLIVFLFLLTTSGQGRPLLMTDRLLSFHGNTKQRECKLPQVEHHLSGKQRGITFLSNLFPDLFDDVDESELNSKISHVTEYHSMIVKSEVRISLYRNNDNKYLDERNFADDERMHENENGDDSSNIYEDEKENEDNNNDNDIDNDDDSFNVYDDEKEDKDNDHDHDHGRNFYEGDNSVGNLGNTPSVAAVYNFLFDDSDKNDDKPIVFEPQDYDKLFEDILAFSEFIMMLLHK